MTLFDAFKLPVKRFFIFILCYQFTVIIGSPSKSNQTLAIHDPLVNFIFVGPTNAFWQHLPDHSFDRVSSKCVRSIEHVLDTVQTGHQWAYQMLDSGAGSLSGILDSSVLHPGDYEQCLRIEAKSFEQEAAQFTGKHFLLTALPRLELLDFELSKRGVNKTMFFDMQTPSILSRLGLLFRFTKYYTLKFGMCMPSTCSQSDVQVLFNQTLQKYDWNLLKVTEGDVTETWSESVGRLRHDHPIAWQFFRLYFVILFGWTMLDLLRVNRLFRFLTPSIKLISIRRNYLHLLRPKNESEKAEQLVDSLRFITVFAAVFLHDVVYTAANGGIPLVKRSYWYLIYGDSLFGQFLMPDAAIPALFLMAATTMTAKLIKMNRSKPPLSEYLKVIASRFLKFAPIISVFVAVEICIQYFYTGPLIKDFSYTLSNKCAERGWSNMLLISNIFNHDQMCLMHTWSTSAEFQLLFIAVALAYTYSRSHRAGLAFNIFLVVSGLVYNFFTVYSKRLQGVIYQMPIHLDNLVNTGNYLHLNTLSHVYSYFMVFLAQYLAEHCKTLSLNRRVRDWIGYILVIGFLFSFYTSTFAYQVLEFEQTYFTNAIIFSIVRISFPLAYCWTLFIERFTARNPQLGKQEGFMNFIRSLMQVKGLSANTKKCDSGAIDANNNNESMTTKIEKAKSNEPTPATIVTVLNRFLTSVYLGHHLLLIWAHFSIHQPFPFKPYQLFIRIFGNLLFGVIAGFVFHLTIEAPVSNVIQQLFGKYLSHGENAKKHID